MNATNTKTKMISRRKSRGFLGSIPKQVALWRVRMTVTMQSCKKPLFFAKFAIILPISLLVGVILFMLDRCFKTPNIPVRFMEIEAFENVQFASGNHNGWDQKSVVKSGELEADFPALENTFFGAFNR